MNKIINDKIKESLNKELNRQQNHIELIASENYVSEAVLQLTGSILTNKYAEGYPGRRYYGGCEFIDEIEQLGIDTAKKLFNAEHANIQPHSGAQANTAAYQAILNPGDKILGMDLAAGGHLTHGSTLSASGITYQGFTYGVDPVTHLINYSEVQKIAKEVKPQVIVAGASAYSRVIDWKRFKEIADSVGAYLMVDMAHIAGLVACGLHSSPIPYADIVTTTTHKTLRGARGGLILCKKELAKKIDSAVFPGTQGGPLENQIAGKTQALLEASTKEYKIYIEQVVKNCKILSETLLDEGFKILTGGTDNHLVNVEIYEAVGITGAQAEKILNSVGIVVNKEKLPFDKLGWKDTSGIRIGTPAMTTRGFKENEFKQVGLLISSALKNQSENNLNMIKQQVKKLTKQFLIYQDIKY